MAGQSSDILRLKCCPQCGYDLAGLPDRHRCPECGFAYSEMMFVVPIHISGGRRGRQSRPFSYWIYRVGLAYLPVCLLLLYLYQGRAWLFCLPLGLVVTYWLLDGLVDQLHIGKPLGRLICNQKGVAIDTGDGKWSSVIPYDAFTDVRLRIRKRGPHALRLRASFDATRRDVTWINANVRLTPAEAATFREQLECRIREAKGTTS